MGQHPVQDSTPIHAFIMPTYLVCEGYVLIGYAYGNESND
ncbi:hypothetical protein vBPFY1MI_87 [Pseudomonas phage vB_PF_Y1-MI]|nr:hypothetical protein vBPFY1MI_87 [Pseudomonas phage vB_PF_Y1-MI]